MDRRIEVATKQGGFSNPSAFIRAGLNVFYELGLAHAAKKPVIFTSSAVDDVPFDLRHLRVIIYEIREPEWSSRLRQSVTDYLRNAMKEPGKSIPHPFRKLAEEAENSSSKPGRR